MRKSVARAASIDLNLVAAFVRVVETGSFTAAAAALGVPKSSVSRGVARLEHALGARLLQRTTRRLHLTDAGQAYHERVRPAVVGVAEANALVEDLGQAPRGHVRLAAPIDLGTEILAALITRFVGRHPEIDVELALGNRAVDLVADGFDLAVRASRLEDSSLIVRRIGPGVLALYATPAYLRKRGRPRRVADLADHAAVLFRARGGRDTWWLTGPDGEERVDVTGRISADDLGFVLRAVQAGAGIGLASPAQYAAARVRGELTRVLPEHAMTGGGVSLCVVMPSSRFVPTRVRLLGDFLVAHLSKLPLAG